MQCSLEMYTQLAFTCRRMWLARPPTRQKAASSTSTTTAPSHNAASPVGTLATGLKPPSRTIHTSWTQPWVTLPALSRSSSSKWLDLDYKRLVNDIKYPFCLFPFLYFFYDWLQPCSSDIILWVGDIGEVLTCNIALFSFLYFFSFEDRSGGTLYHMRAFAFFCSIVCCCTLGLVFWFFV